MIEGERLTADTGETGRTLHHPSPLFPRTTLIRRVAAALAMALALLATVITIYPLLNILYLVLRQGIPALSGALFTRNTVGGDMGTTNAGLSNAITGSLLIVAVSLVLAAPLGILGGIYLSEFAPPRIAASLRYLANVLSGVPSIVLGYFGYVVMVVWFGWGFSLLAAAITLTIIMLPYILRATELAMEKVPATLREGSLALGADRSATVLRVVLKAATPGVLTGLILAISLAMGETAPLIYTAGWSDYLPTLQAVHSPVGYLTYVIWTFINEPFAAAHALAYAAALFLIAFILILNVGLRTLVERKSVRS